MTDDERLDLVRRDIDLGLSHAFEPRDEGWHPVATLVEDGLPSNGRSTAVPWELPCTHTAPFLDIPATNRALTIRGVTIVLENGDDKDAARLHRYIDWAQVMSDLGIQATFRPVLEFRP